MYAHVKHAIWPWNRTLEFEPKAEIYASNQAVAVVTSEASFARL